MRFLVAWGVFYWEIRKSLPLAGVATRGHDSIVEQLHQVDTAGVTVFTTGQGARTWG